MSLWRTVKTFARKSISLPGVIPPNRTLTGRAIGIILLCALAVGAAAYLNRDAIQRLVAQPAHHAPVRLLVEQVQTADQIIFSLLEKLSLPEDALSLQQQEKHDSSGDWYFTLITVTMPAALTFPQVENTFTRGFAFFEEEALTSRFAFDGDNCLNVTVYIQEQQTHRLVFCQKPVTTGKATEGEREKEVERYRVAIVIDDLGENYNSYRALSSINVPFTYSILPFQTHSIRIATEVNKRHGEVILHLPLEPWNSSEHAINHGTLLTSMSREELNSQLERNINAVPHLSGVSNHMGSKFTEYQEGMETVLRAIKKRGLYFLDSRTSDKTVGYTLAKEMRIRAAERNLFIDNDHNQLSAEKQLKKIPRLARKHGGKVVAIGHPYPSTIEALKQCVPLLEEQGITIVPLSELLD